MTETALNQEIVINREFNAPRALVFRVWTDPFHLAHWWVPYGFKARIVKMEVKTGGIFHINLQSDEGTVYPSKGVFQEIVEPEMIRLAGDENAPDACGAGLPPKAIVTISFAERGEKTWLTLHTQFITVAEKQAATAAGFNVGWHSALTALNDYLGAIEGNN